MQGEEEEGDSQRIGVCFVTGEQEREHIACNGGLRKTSLRKEVWRIFVRALVMDEVEAVREPNKLASLTTELCLDLLRLALSQKFER